MKTSPTLAFLVGFASLAAAGPAPAEEPKVLFTLTDPRGDDNGDGDFVYPRRDDLRPGDLDIVSFTAKAAKDGTLFEATFARPIRPTARRTIDEVGTSLDTVARYGFYTFNIDVYIDTDRVPGSGSTQALPGRGVEIDAASAWEKAICVTPRPQEARPALERILTSFARRDAKARGEKLDRLKLRDMQYEVSHDIDARIFFPKVIHVFGPTISFFVPASFLGGEAKPTWSYVVAVSGADIKQKFDLGAALGLFEPVPDRLMILPVIQGAPMAEAFGGGRDDPPQPAVVDVIVPANRSQEDLLKERPAKLPGVVPAEVKK